MTNKCGEEDLEYYIRECGEILGVNPKLPQGAQVTKSIPPPPPRLIKYQYIPPPSLPCSIIDATTELPTKDYAIIIYNRLQEDQTKSTNSIDLI